MKWNYRCPHCTASLAVDWEERSQRFRDCILLDRLVEAASPGTPYRERLED